jgi:hypothetical protein
MRVLFALLEIGMAAKSRPRAGIVAWSAVGESTLRTFPGKILGGQLHCLRLKGS